MIEAIEPGPAIIGIAIGKTEMSSGSRALDLLGPVLAALGALLEHHVDRDQEEEDAAGDPEGGERDAERAQQILAEQGEEEQDAGGDADRADGHRPGGAAASRPR